MSYNYKKFDTVETNCTIFYHILKLKILNRVRKQLYCYTYSNPSRKHSEAVHLMEE